MRLIGSEAYQYLHKQIIIRLVYFCVMMINVVLATNGISDRFTPREIVTGRRLNLIHIKAGFGDYIEASTDKIVTNGLFQYYYSLFNLRRLCKTSTDNSFKFF